MCKNNLIIMFCVVMNESSACFTCYFSALKIFYSPEAPNMLLCLQEERLCPLCFLSSLWTDLILLYPLVCLLLSPTPDPPPLSNCWHKHHKSHLVGPDRPKRGQLKCRFWKGTEDRMNMCFQTGIYEYCTGSLPTEPFPVPSGARLPCPPVTATCSLSCMFSSLLVSVNYVS